MPRVDFYILPDRQRQAIEFTACRLADKAYRADHRVFVRVSSPAEAREFDERLWTFRDGSFVPHAVAGEPAAGAQAERHAVLIGWTDGPATHRDLLINLTAEVPQDFERFERIVEVVDADEERRRQGRQRFRDYRERGFEPTTHQL